jgi:hypothetical protein
MTTLEVTHKHLLGEDTWDRVVYHIERTSAVTDLNSDNPRQLSERILDQTIAFLLCCGAKDPKDPPLSATPHIDEAWHWFVLHLGQYLKFCDENFGRVILHNPYHPDKDFDASQKLTEGRARAKAAMRDLGLHLDGDIWALPYHGNTHGNCDDACSYAY